MKNALRSRPPGDRPLDPLIGPEAASLNARVAMWHLIAIGIYMLFAGLMLLVVPLRAYYVPGAPISVAAIALARGVWLAHREARAAERYLTSQLGFPVRMGFTGPTTPAQWRKRIAREAERHARDADVPPR